MTSKLLGILRNHESDILAEWIGQQSLAVSSRGKPAHEGEQRQPAALLSAIRSAWEAGGSVDISAPAWENARSLLTGISQTRARQGSTPGETAMFIFSLKRPLFARLRKEHGQDAAGITEDTWASTEILGGLGLVTFEAFTKGREEVITRQQQEMLELSTPVIQLWDGVLALPLIGTLDSGRTREASPCRWRERPPAAMATLSVRPAHACG